MVDNGEGEKTQTKIPVNILRYLPVIPRIQRLYMMEETARQMTWHKYGKRTEFDADGKQMLTHPSDGLAWKHFDEKHWEKAEEARHVRVTVGTDGFNSFGLMATSYSCWLVFFATQSPPLRDYEKEEHFPDIDNTKAQISGEEYGCVHAAA